MSKESSNDNTTNNNQSNSENINSTEVLQKQLQTIDLAIDTLYVLILGVILNIYRSNINKIKILDTLNNTNNYNKLGDISNLPKVIFAIFLYTSGVFLEINYSNYTDLVNSSGTTNNTSSSGNDTDSSATSTSNQNAINKAYIGFFASLIILVGTIIGGSNNLET